MAGLEDYNLEDEKKYDSPAHVIFSTKKVADYQTKTGLAAFHLDDEVHSQPLETSSDINFQHIGASIPTAFDANQHKPPSGTFEELMQLPSVDKLGDTELLYTLESIREFLDAEKNLPPEIQNEWTPSDLPPFKIAEALGDITDFPLLGLNSKGIDAIYNGTLSTPARLRVRAAWVIGKAQMNIADLYIPELLHGLIDTQRDSMADRDQMAEILQQYMQLQEPLGIGTNFADSPWYQELQSMPARTVMTTPYMFRAYGSGIGYGGAGAVAGAGTGALLGLAWNLKTGRKNLQTPLKWGMKGADLLTKKGFSFGLWKETSLIEGALFFSDLVRMKDEETGEPLVDRNLARYLALVVGGINGVFESWQLTGMAKGLGGHQIKLGTKKLLKNGKIKKALAKVRSHIKKTGKAPTDDVLRQAFGDEWSAWVTQPAKSMGLAVGTQAMQEGLQEIGPAFFKEFFEGLNEVVKENVAAEWDMHVDLDTGEIIKTPSEYHGKSRVRDLFFSNMAERLPVMLDTISKSARAGALASVGPSVISQGVGAGGLYASGYFDYMQDTVTATLLQMDLDADIAFNVKEGSWSFAPGAEVNRQNLRHLLHKSTGRSQREVSAEIRLIEAQLRQYNEYTGNNFTLDEFLNNTMLTSLPGDITPIATLHQQNLAIENLENADIETVGGETVERRVLNVPLSEYIPNATGTVLEGEEAQKWQEENETPAHLQRSDKRKAGKRKRVTVYPKRNIQARLVFQKNKEGVFVLQDILGVTEVTRKGVKTKQESSLLDKILPSDKPRPFLNAEGLEIIRGYMDEAGIDVLEKAPAPTEVSKFDQAYEGLLKNKIRRVMNPYDVGESALESFFGDIESAIAEGHEGKVIQTNDAGDVVRSLEYSEGLMVSAREALGNGNLEHAFDFADQAVRGLGFDSYTPPAKPMNTPGMKQIVPDQDVFDVLRNQVLRELRIAMPKVGATRRGRRWTADERMMEARQNLIWENFFDLYSSMGAKFDKQMSFIESILGPESESVQKLKGYRQSLIERTHRGQYVFHGGRKIKDPNPEWVQSLPAEGMVLKGKDITKDANTARVMIQQLDRMNTLSNLYSESVIAAVQNKLRTMEFGTDVIAVWEKQKMAFTAEELLVLADFFTIIESGMTNPMGLGLSEEASAGARLEDNFVSGGDFTAFFTKMKILSRKKVDQQGSKGFEQAAKQRREKKAKAKEERYRRSSSNPPIRYLSPYVDEIWDEVYEMVEEGQPNTKIYQRVERMFNELYENQQTQSEYSLRRVAPNKLRSSDTGYNSADSKVQLYDGSGGHFVRTGYLQRIVKAVRDAYDGDQLVESYDIAQLLEQNLPAEEVGLESIYDKERIQSEINMLREAHARHAGMPFEWLFYLQEYGLIGPLPGAELHLSSEQRTAHAERTLEIKALRALLLPEFLSPEFGAQLETARGSKVRKPYEEGESEGEAQKSILSAREASENFYDMPPGLKSSQDSTKGLSYYDHYKKGSGKRLEQLDKNGNIRGRVTLFADGQAYLEFMKTADLDTGLHEFAHIFFRGMPDKYISIIATAVTQANLPVKGQVDPSEMFLLEGDADRQQMYMVKAMKKWKDGAEFSDFSVREIEAFEVVQEAYAEWYVAFVREGVSPNPRLDSIFKDFHAWLGNIYGTMSARDRLELPESVRELFQETYMSSREKGSGRILASHGRAYDVFVPETGPYAGKSVIKMTSKEVNQRLEQLAVQGKRDAERKARVKKNKQFREQYNLPYDGEYTVLIDVTPYITNKGGVDMDPNFYYTLLGRPKDGVRWESAIDRQIEFEYDLSHEWTQREYNRLSEKQLQDLARKYGLKAGKLTPHSEPELRAKVAARKRALRKYTVEELEAETFRLGLNKAQIADKEAEEAVLGYDIDSAFEDLYEVRGNAGIPESVRVSTELDIRERIIKTLIHEESRQDLAAAREELISRIRHHREVLQEVVTLTAEVSAEEADVLFGLLMDRVHDVIEKAEKAPVAISKYIFGSMIGAVETLAGGGWAQRQLANNARNVVDEQKAYDGRFADSIKNLVKKSRGFTYKQQVALHKLRKKVIVGTGYFDPVTGQEHRAVVSKLAFHMEPELWSDFMDTVKYPELIISEEEQEIVNALKEIMALTGLATEEAKVMISRANPETHQLELFDEFRAKREEKDPISHRPMGKLSGEVMPRNFTREFMDLLLSNDSRYRDALAKVIVGLNPGLSEDYVLTQLDEAKVLRASRHIGMEIMRQFERMPTHLKVHDRNEPVPLMETEPMYAGMAVARETALRLGFLKIFPDQTSESITTEVDNFVASMPQVNRNEAHEAATGLFRTLNGMPLSDFMERHNELTAPLLRTLSIFLTMYKAKLLGKAVWRNLVETPAKVPMYVGWDIWTKTVGEIGATVLNDIWKNITFQQLGFQQLNEMRHQFVAMGAVSHLYANAIFRRGRMLEDFSQVYSRGLLVTTLVSKANEFNELFAAISGAQFVSDLKNGKMTEFKRHSLRLMGFSDQEIQEIVQSGEDISEEYQRAIVQRLPSLTQGTNLKPAEMSPWQNRPELKDVFAFWTYFRRTALTGHQAMKEVAETFPMIYKMMHGGKPAPKFSWSEVRYRWMFFGNFMFGHTVSGTTGTILRQSVHFGPSTWFMFQDWDQDDDDNNVDDVAWFLAKGFGSGTMSGQLEGFARGYKERPANIGTLPDILWGLTLPAGYMTEWGAVLGGQGKYANMSFGERIIAAGMYRTTAQDTVRNVLSMMDLADFDRRMALARQKFYEALPKVNQRTFQPGWFEEKEKDNRKFSQLMGEFNRYVAGTGAMGKRKLFQDTNPETNRAYIDDLFAATDRGRRAREILSEAFEVADINQFMPLPADDIARDMLQKVKDRIRGRKLWTKVDNDKIGEMTKRLSAAVIYETNRWDALLQDIIDHIDYAIEMGQLEASGVELTQEQANVYKQAAMVSAAGKAKDRGEQYLPAFEEY